MDVDHVRVLKKELEQNVFKLMYDFEIRTGTSISRIDSKTTVPIGHKSELLQIEITAEV